MWYDQLDCPQGPDPLLSISQPPKPNPSMSCLTVRSVQALEPDLGALHCHQRCKPKTWLCQRRLSSSPVCDWGVGMKEEHVVHILRREAENLRFKVLSKCESTCKELLFYFGLVQKNNIFFYNFLIMYII